MDVKNIHLMEIEGTPIKGVLHAPKKEEDPQAVIADLRSIINKKNLIIERQTDYIAELQDEIRVLRSSVRMLSL